MQKKEYPDYINVAVEWCVEKIKCPTFDTGNEQADMYLFYNFLEHSENLSIGAINTFKQKLGKLINKDINSVGKATIFSNSSPLGIIAEALNAADIDTRRCPPNTCMLITTDSVEVRCGINNEFKEIYKRENKKSL